ncbi:unnamed protein product [Ambrosiozyma monospora]|uniref:Unnamed protein product n=1 Tax=Ambrosiozyma monospora TaxID=43982 RepID=A0ACB5SYY3_AMBMO|nr:unnamed protein product [Ambrosiozyma monospora]
MNKFTNNTNMSMFRYNDPFFNFFDNVHREVQQMNDLFDDPFFSNCYGSEQQPQQQQSIEPSNEKKDTTTNNKDNTDASKQVASTQAPPKRVTPFFGSSFFNDDDPFFGGSLSNYATKFSPPVDIHENDKSYDLSLAIPGATKDHVTIDFNTDTNELIVKGEVPENKVEEKDDNGKLVYSEMSSGSFQRVFRLPKSVEGKAINSQFENGVLSLSVPKVEEEKKNTLHRINIGGGDATKDEGSKDASGDTEMKN